MSKDLNVTLLIDCYGNLLTEKQRLLVECYYNDDLSLTEISENEGITRQGAGDAIAKAVAKLRSYEESLNLVKKISELKQLAAFAKADGNYDKLIDYIDNF